MTKCRKPAATAGIPRRSSPDFDRHPGRRARGHGPGPNRGEAMSITLYYAPGACSFASHIALEEVGLPYETVRLDLAAGDQRKPEYLRINPRGRVPTVIVDGHALTENVGIMTYLAG